MPICQSNVQSGISLRRGGLLAKVTSNTGLSICLVLSLLAVLDQRTCPCHRRHRLNK